MYRFLLTLLCCLPFLSGAILKVSGAGNHVLILKEDGTLWGFGDCSSGKLASTTCTKLTTPTLIPLPHPAVDISATTDASFALLNNGELYTWGRGRTAIPSPIAGLSTISQFQARDRSGIAITTTGEAYIWGLYNGTRAIDPPRLIEGLPPISQAAVGVSTLQGTIHFVALGKDGSVWTWGNNNRGQLGNGTQQSSDTPVKVALPPAISVAACQDCSLAALANGTVWAWGRNDSTIAGNGVNVQAQFFDKPVQVPGVAGAIQVSSGIGHAAALLKDGTIRTWGHDGWGQAGIGTAGGYQLRAVKPTLTGTTSINLESNRAFAITKTGRAWFWGTNTVNVPGPFAKDRHIPTELLLP